MNALYAKRRQITMPMMHGFGTIENKLTGRLTHYMQRFRAHLLHLAGFGAEAEEFGGLLA
ncbi:hypothetical protein [Bradyrhizobium cosmicum]|uniref:hypothetical protein n=1 Tax=Bradyrhizobium cosmicum TaxID=1404864 RepID=UPI0005A0B450|nr:hypothetical protein [Bradyrhizobium cosmicum]